MERGKIEKEGSSFICWFAPKRATKARAGLDYSKEPGAWSCIPY